MKITSDIKSWPHKRMVPLMKKPMKTEDPKTLACWNLLPLILAWPWLHPGAHCPPLSPSPCQQCSFTIMHYSTVLQTISHSIWRITERNRTLLRVGHWCKCDKLFSWSYSFPKSIKNTAICMYYRDSILLILCKLQCKVTIFQAVHSSRNTTSKTRLPE